MITTCLFLATMLPQTPADRPTSIVVPGKVHQRGNAESVAISRDGKYIAASFGGPSNARFPLQPRGGGIVVWETKSGEVVLEHGEYGDIVKIDFSPDGKYVAYARLYTPGDSIELNVVRVLNVGTGQVVFDKPGETFVFATHEDTFLFGSRADLKVLDRSNWKPLWTIDMNGVGGRGSRVRALTLSADGMTAAALCYHWVDNRGNPGGLAVFDPSKKQIDSIRGDASLRNAMAVAFSPDGRQIVTGHTEGRATIWSVDPDQKPTRLTVKTNLSVFPLFLDEGKSLALFTQPANSPQWTYDSTQPSGFDIKQSGSPSGADLYRFDVKTSQETLPRWRFENASYKTYYYRFGSSKNHPEANPVKWVLSADGKTLVAGCNGCSEIDLASGKIIRQYISKPTE